MIKCDVLLFQLGSFNSYSQQQKKESNVVTSIVKTMRNMRIKIFDQDWVIL
jgi:hypothetical protein